MIDIESLAIGVVLGALMMSGAFAAFLEPLA